MPRILPFYYYLTGYKALATDASHAAALLDICRRGMYVYDEFRHLPDGGISLTFPRRVARTVERAAGASDIPLVGMDEGGLPTRLRRLVHRPGLILGCLLGIAFYIAGTQVVWDIRIEGNTTMSDRSVEDTLAACGFTVGSSLRHFHADVLENQILLTDDRLAWISINRRGTVAYVELREASHTPPSPPSAPADLVASIGGIIERVELDEGNVRVAAGQAVSPGDILVSGIYDSQVEGIRLTRARARIYARTERELTVTIPLSYEQKVFFPETEDSSMEIRQEKTLIFFKKPIKFTKKTGQFTGDCDIIIEQQDLGLFSDVGFPVSVRTVWYLPYEMSTATRTYAEAEELAYIELARQIAALPGGAELISKTITVTRSPDSLILRCMLICVEDIGTVREIQVGH